MRSAPAQRLLAADDMKSPLVLPCLLLSAACQNSPETGTTEQEICDCDKRPQLCCCLSPVLLDIAGNGFELTPLDGGVNVAPRPDYEHTMRAWTKPESDDAWLVLDRNDNGVIDDMAEMFGNTTPQPPPPEGLPNGFLALSPYDDNGDKIIDKNDRIFGSLRLWQDKNHDAVSQPDELHELPELGVAGISVAYTDARRGDGQGNLFLYTASVYGTPGSTVGTSAWDVWLTGVQSKPIPGAPPHAASPVPAVGTASVQHDSSSATTSSSSSYFTCDAECTSGLRSCPMRYHTGQTVSVYQDEGAADALAICHNDIADFPYCAARPMYDSSSCTRTDGPGVLYLCTASCVDGRTNVPSDCGYLIEVTGASSPSLSQAQRNAIAKCTSQAAENFCSLSPNPNDTPVDSPDDVIDDVTVVHCTYHPGGGGGPGC